MLYGRDVERAEIWTLLEDARASKSGALVLRGEAGIGKTALLEDARERTADMQVLRARGVESESELPFAGLHQLLRPALDHIERLPAPQAAALRGALGLEEGGAHESFLVFAACLSLLSELADRRPVLCLVDDAHWLDAGSSDALLFVARRLDAEGIVILFGAREGDVRAFESPGLPSLVLGGLDSGAAADVLRRGAGIDAVAAVRDRLMEQTRGNALALLELPSVLTPDQLAGVEPLPETLPLTRHVESVFLERVRRLPAETQQVLLVAAADDSADLGLVTRAAALLDVGPRALDAAEAAGLVVVRGVRCDFRHPLVRSALYEAASSSERRSVHRALADVLADDDENADRRAWHLANSAVQHDETVLRALDAAAERAEGRAAHMTAAKALERAADLSDDDASRGRRLAGAARCASVAGADGHAVALANRAAPLVDEPLARADLARVLGLAEIRRGRPVEAVPTLLAAVREIASTHPDKALDLLLDVFWAASEGGSLEAHGAIRELAGTITPTADDEASVFIGNLLGGLTAISAGDSDRGVSLLESALAWAASADEPRYVLWAGWAAVTLGDPEQAEALFARGARLARARGAIGLLSTALRLMGLQHFLAQRFDRSALACGEAVQFARDIGAENHLPAPLAILAEIGAIHGDHDEARLRADEALEGATARGLALAAVWAYRALAAIDLAGGRWLEALERLEFLEAQRLAGVLHPLVLETMPDRVEAAVRAGLPERGRTALAAYETWAEQSGRPRARSRLEGCRALLADGAGATEHYEEAVSLGTDAAPFDLARVQLLYGEHLRRQRRRADSRMQLRAALEGFERVRAEPWAERARGELRATGETARKRDASRIDQLTAQELQIARFVSEGLTNKEVAAQLFLSPRTIDSHLRNVFSKLGVKSRTQLARLPLGEDGALAEPAAVRSS
jgi:DNA-binding CsgD family transcriptional regulator